MDYIQELTQHEEDSCIANISERNPLLTKIMRNEEQDENITASDRLRACDLLNKASGVYLKESYLTVNASISVNHDVQYIIEGV